MDIKIIRIMGIIRPIGIIGILGIKRIVRNNKHYKDNVYICAFGEHHVYNAIPEIKNCQMYTVQIHFRSQHR